MESQSLTPSGDIKQEPDYEAEVKVERNSPIFWEVKKEDLDESQVGDCKEDSSPLVQKADNIKSEVSTMETVGQSEARRDDVDALPNEACSTESDQNFSECEMDTGLCGTNTICGLESKADINPYQNINNTGKTFTCDLCGAGFVNSSKLEIHKRTHTGEKPYKCDMCGVGFADNAKLKRHKRIHTGEKPYKCDVRFAHSEALKIHTITNTGENPYKCDLCGVGFAQSQNLKIHKITHTKEKPYKCDVCGVGFTQRGHIQIHKRTHTGEKPYMCGVGFTENGQLKKH